MWGRGGTAERFHWEISSSMKERIIRFNWGTKRENVHFVRTEKENWPKTGICAAHTCIPQYKENPPRVWGGVVMWYRASGFRSKGPGFKTTSAVSKLGQFRLPPLCPCLSEETVKAVGPFYLVSYARGSKRSHAGKWKKTCDGLTHSREGHS